MKERRYSSNGRPTKRRRLDVGNDGLSSSYRVSSQELDLAKAPKGAEDGRGFSDFPEGGTSGVDPIVEEAKLSIQCRKGAEHVDEFSDFSDHELPELDRILHDAEHADEFSDFSDHELPELNRILRDAEHADEFSDFSDRELPELDRILQDAEHADEFSDDELPELEQFLPYAESKIGGVTTGTLSQPADLPTEDFPPPRKPVNWLTEPNGPRQSVRPCSGQTAPDAARAGQLSAAASRPFPLYQRSVNTWPPEHDLGVYSHGHIVTEEKYRCLLSKVGLYDRLFFSCDMEELGEEMGVFPFEADALEGNIFGRDPSPDRWPFLTFDGDRAFQSGEYKLLAGSSLCIQSRFSNEEGKRVYIQLSENQAAEMSDPLRQVLGYRFRTMSRDEFAIAGKDAYSPNKSEAISSALRKLRVLRPPPDRPWKFDLSLPLIASKRSELFRSGNAVLPPDSSLCLAVNYNQFNQPTYAKLNVFQAAQFTEQEKRFLGLRPLWAASLTPFEQYKFGLLPPGSAALKSALAVDSELRTYFEENRLRRLDRGYTAREKEAGSPRCEPVRGQAQPEKYDERSRGRGSLIR